MFELLAKTSIVFDNKNIILDVLDKVVTYITTDGELPFLTGPYQGGTYLFICEQQRHRSAYASTQSDQ